MSIDTKILIVWMPLLLPINCKTKQHNATFSFKSISLTSHWLKFYTVVIYDSYWFFFIHLTNVNAMCDTKHLWQMQENVRFNSITNFVWHITDKFMAPSIPSITYLIRPIWCDLFENACLIDYIHGLRYIHTNRQIPFLLIVGITILISANIWLFIHRFAGIFNQV